MSNEDEMMENVDPTVAEYLQGWLTWQNTLYVERGW